MKEWIIKKWWILLPFSILFNFAIGYNFVLSFVSFFYLIGIVLITVMKRIIGSIDNPEIVQYRSMSGYLYLMYIVLYVMGLISNPFLYRLMDDFFHSNNQFEILITLAPVSIILGYVFYTIGSLAILFKVIEMDRTVIPKST